MVANSNNTDRKATNKQSLTKESNYIFTILRQL